MKHRKQVTNEQVVAAYMDAYKDRRDIQSVGRSLGVVAPTVYNRLRLLRFHGLKLPKLVRKARLKRVVDVQALKKIIAEHCS